MIEKKNPFQLVGGKRVLTLFKNANSIELLRKLQHLNEMEISL